MPLVIPSVSVRVWHNFCFFRLRFWICFLLPFLVPFALYLQQFATVFATFWHGNFAFCIVFATVGIGNVRLPLCTDVHCIYHILAFELFICMVFATFWCFKRSCCSPEDCLKISCRVSCRVFLRVSVVVSFRVSFRVSLRFNWGFHLEFPYGFI